MTTTFPTRRSSDFIGADDDVAAAGQRLIADRYRRRHAVVVGIEGAAGGDLHTSPEHDRSVIRRKLAARLYETVVAHPDGAAGPGLEDRITADPDTPAECDRAPSGVLETQHTIVHEEIRPRRDVAMMDGRAGRHVYSTVAGGHTDGPVERRASREKRGE